MLDLTEAVLNVHTGDIEYDYIDANHVACPRLSELSEEALTSTEWLNR